MSHRPIAPDERALERITELGSQFLALNRRAVEEYTPVVEAILSSGRRDTSHIERTLDGLLDFCGHPPIVELYCCLCRHYWAIDPVATVRYADFYRETWGAEKKPVAEMAL